MGNGTVPYACVHPLEPLFHDEPPERVVVANLLLQTKFVIPGGSRWQKVRPSASTLTRSADMDIHPC